MRAIVMSAGTGSRLENLTDCRCKGMVPVNGTLLIDYTLDFLKNGNFSEIIVVGGFCYEGLRDHLVKKNVQNLKIVFNRDYEKGNIFTLKKALDEFNDDSFLLCNVDHIYPDAMFPLMKKLSTGITAMCDKDRILSNDDMKVSLWDDSLQIRKISKTLQDYDFGYIGMTFVDRESEGLYRGVLDETILKNGENAVVENILSILGEDKKTAPDICDLSGFGWHEVDDAVDLKSAEASLKCSLVKK